MIIPWSVDHPQEKLQLLDTFINLESSYCHWSWRPIKEKIMFTVRGGCIILGLMVFFFSCKFLAKLTGKSSKYSSNHINGYPQSSITLSHFSSSQSKALLILPNPNSTHYQTQLRRSFTHTHQKSSRLHKKKGLKKSCQKSLNFNFYIHWNILFVSIKPLKNSKNS